MHHRRQPRLVPPVNAALKGARQEYHHGLVAAGRRKHERRVAGRILGDAGVLVVGLGDEVLDDAEMALFGGEVQRGVAGVVGVVKCVGVVLEDAFGSSGGVLVVAASGRAGGCGEGELTGGGRRRGWRGGGGWRLRSCYYWVSLV